MIPSIAKVVYEARRAVAPAQVTDDDGATFATEPGLPFDELTSADREPLLAEVQSYLQSGTEMNDALGRAIVDALK